MKQPTHGGNLSWAATLAGCSPYLILDFSASINPLGPPASAIATLHAHLDRLRDYPDPEYRDLRHALAEFHHLPADWILPGNGSAELLTWAGRELATLDSVELWVPAFRDYLRSLQAFDAQIVFRDINQVLSEPIHPTVAPTTSSQVGILINNPHNPTGKLFSLEMLKPYLQEFALVVVDEAFMDFLPPGEPLSLLDWVQDYPNLVVLRSLTKFYSLPGLRLGYAIAHPDRLKRWQRWRDPWSVNTLAAAAAIAVVQDTDFQQKTWEWLPGARSQLFHGLSQIPGLQPQPGAANFLLVESQCSVVALQHQLLQKFRVLIRDCTSFPELGDRYFRVAVRTPEENETLLAALRACLNSEKTPGV